MHEINVNKLFEILMRQAEKLRGSNERNCQRLLQQLKNVQKDFMAQRIGLQQIEQQLGDKFDFNAANQELAMEMKSVNAKREPLVRAEEPAPSKKQKVEKQVDETDDLLKGGNVLKLAGVLASGDSGKSESKIDRTLVSDSNRFLDTRQVREHLSYMCQQNSLSDYDDNVLGILS